MIVVDFAIIPRDARGRASLSRCSRPALVGGCTSHLREEFIEQRRGEPPLAVRNHLLQRHTESRGKDLLVEVPQLSPHERPPDRVVEPLTHRALLRERRHWAIDDSRHGRGYGL